MLSYDELNEMVDFYGEDEFSELFPEEFARWEQQNTQSEECDTENFNRHNIPEAN